MSFFWTIQSCAPAKLGSAIKKSPVFANNFTGFALYDPATKKYLIRNEIDKYYTPASNTKILTLYTSLLHLPDEVPILQYRVSGDTTYIRGVAHPGLLHPYLPPASTTLSWLKSQPGQLVLVDRKTDVRYGPGWAWEDFNDYYQPERSALPLHGNVIIIRADSASTSLLVQPKTFKVYQRTSSEPSGVSPRIWRKDDLDNRWYYNGVASRRNLYRELPFHPDPGLQCLVLQEYLQKPVTWIPEQEEMKIWYDLKSEIPLDSLYKLMMQVSDNFVAEQLLWMCAHQTHGTLHSDSIIHMMQHTALVERSDSLQWVDGSGLSRYNLFTPRTMVEILEQIYRLKPLTWIQDIFPAGGQSGTLGNWYKGPDGYPYLWAKTGSLWNQYTLSGYLITKKRRLLIFSFMHNNFTSPSVKLRREMQTILESVYTRF